MVPPAVENKTVVLHPDHRGLVEDAIREGFLRAEIHPCHASHSSGDDE